MSLPFFSFQVTLVARLCQLALLTTPSALAAVYHGTIEVKQTITSTSLKLRPGSSPGVSLANSRNADAGDYILNLPGRAGVGEGVLITSVAKNGKQFSKHLTTSASHGFGVAPNQFHISAHQAGNFSGKGHCDSAFAFFPYETWLCGTMISDPEGGKSYSLSASPGIELDDEFTLTPRIPGVFEIDLSATPHNASSQNGILLVNGAKDENNFALSKVNSKGSFNIYCHDNNVDGSTYEQDPVNFVYLGEDDLGKDGLVAMGRITGDGSVQLGAGDFSVRKPGGTTGLWVVEIPGHSSDTGTLIISPEGGGTFNIDNIISLEWSSGSQWVIQSRDLPDLGLQDGNPSEPMFSFAFFARPVIVTTLVDEDDGATALETPTDISLREAINHGPPLAPIHFAPALSGGNLDLSLDHLLIDRSLTIDASGLPDGLTIDANGREHRIMEIASNIKVSLDGLTLTGGYPRSNVFFLIVFDGGAIRCGKADLFLNNCTISGNIGEEGGGIYNRGKISLNSCTVAGNSSRTYGGGICSREFSDRSTLNLSSCTISGNSASYSGGGIYIVGNSAVSTILNLSSCTVSNNSAASKGGGIRNINGRINLSTTILAGNSAASGPDLEQGQSGVTTLTGMNLMSDTSDSPFDGLTPAGLIIAPPNLAPLGDNGGPTHTMPPRVGSPAIDAAGTVDPGGTDQRGLNRFFASRLDIGAVEVQGTNYLSQIWDTDSDGDGRPFGVEFALGTDPLVSDPENPAHFNVSATPSGKPLITFGYNPEAVGYVIWSLQHSTDLEHWFPTFSMTNPLGPTEFTDSDASGNSYFHRFGAELVIPQ